MFCYRWISIYACLLVGGLSGNCLAETEFFKINEVEVNKDTVRIFKDKIWVRSLAFRPDAKQMAIAITNNPIRIIDVETGNTWKILKAPERVVDNAMTISAWSPDGKTIAVFWGTKLPKQQDYTVALYDAESMELQGTAGTLKLPPSQLQWATAERIVLKFEQIPAKPGTSAVSYELLNIKSGETSSFAKTNNGATPLVVPSVAGGLLALGAEKAFKLLDAETQKELDLQKLDSLVQGFSFSQDGKFLLIDTANSVQQYDIATKKLKLVVTKKSLERGNWNVSYGPDALTFVAKLPNRLRQYEIKSGKSLKLSPRIDESFQYAITPDGKELAICENGVNLGLWQIAEPGKHRAISPELKKERIVRVWTMDTGQVIGEAELLKKSEKSILLRRKNDPTQLIMPLEMLSPADREFLKKLP